MQVQRDLAAVQATHRPGSEAVSSGGRQEARNGASGRSNDPHPGHPSRTRLRRAVEREKHPAVKRDALRDDARCQIQLKSRRTACHVAD